MQYCAIYLWTDVKNVIFDTIVSIMRFTDTCTYKVIHTTVLTLWLADTFYYRSMTPFVKYYVRVREDLVNVNIGTYKSWLSIIMTKICRYLPRFEDSSQQYLFSCSTIFSWRNINKDSKKRTEKLETFQES